MEEIMAQSMLPEGTRIYYRGDMANNEGFGTIAKAYTNRWGYFYDLEMDDGRRFEGTHTIAVHTVDSGNGSTRFVTLDAYKTRYLEQTPKESPFYRFVVQRMEALT
jgi:hypothetical protein